MNIKTIERRDVSILGRPKHFEFTVILENGDRIRMTAGELLDSFRCQGVILEQTGHLVESPNDWVTFLRAYLK